MKYIACNCPSLDRCEYCYKQETTCENINNCPIKHIINLCLFYKNLPIPNDLEKSLLPSLCDEILLMLNVKEDKSEIDTLDTIRQIKELCLNNLAINSAKELFGSVEQDILHLLEKRDNEKG